MSPERAALLERETLLLVEARHDPEQFGELFKLMWPALVDRLARQTMCQEVAADLASETFAKVVLKVDRFDPEQAPARAWVWGIAQNQLRGWVRHGQVDGRARRKLGFHPVADADAIDDLLTQTVAADLRDHLIAALQQLTPTTRRLVEMKVVEHRSYADIAEALDCSEHSARVRFARAIVKLRVAMADQPGTEAWQ